MQRICISMPVSHNEHYSQKVIENNPKKANEQIQKICEGLKKLLSILSNSSGSEIDKMEIDVKFLFGYFEALLNSSDTMYNKIMANANTFDEWCSKYVVGGTSNHKYNDGRGGYINCEEVFGVLSYSGDSSNDLAYINTTLTDKITNYSEFKIVTNTFNGKRVIDEMEGFSNVNKDTLDLIDTKTTYITDEEKEKIKSVAKVVANFHNSGSIGSPNRENFFQPNQK